MCLAAWWPWPWPLCCCAAWPCPAAVPSHRRRDATSDQPQQTAEGVNVNYGLSNPWDSLMPYYSVSGSNYSRIIYDKIYDRLAYVSPTAPACPGRREKWESTEDGHAIVFTLNQKAAFHDGTPVTAQHWVETFQLITDPACEILGKTALSCLDRHG